MSCILIDRFLPLVVTLGSERKKERKEKGKDSRERKKRI